MLNEEWTTTQIADARKNHALVTETVCNLIKELLSDQFAARVLAASELKEISLTLMTEMMHDSPEKDGEQ
jgi:hypothetical protein